MHFFFNGGLEPFKSVYFRSLPKFDNSIFHNYSICNMIFSSKAEFYLNSGPPPPPHPSKKNQWSFCIDSYPGVAEFWMVIVNHVYMEFHATKFFGQSKKYNRETAWCKKPRITLEREKNWNIFTRILYPHILPIKWK